MPHAATADEAATQQVLKDLGPMPVPQPPSLQDHPRPPTVVPPTLRAARQQICPGLGGSKEQREGGDLTPVCHGATNSQSPLGFQALLALVAEEHEREMAELRTSLAPKAASSDLCQRAGDGKAEARSETAAHPPAQLLRPEACSKDGNQSATAAVADDAVDPAVGQPGVVYYSSQTEEDQGQRQSVEETNRESGRMSKESSGYAASGGARGRVCFSAEADERTRQSGKHRGSLRNRARLAAEEACSSWGTIGTMFPPSPHAQEDEEGHGSGCHDADELPAFPMPTDVDGSQRLHFPIRPAWTKREKPMVAQGTVSTAMSISTATFSEQAEDAKNGAEGENSDRLRKQPAYDGFLRHIISFPQSPCRLAWDLTGGILITFDLIGIPLFLAFKPPDSAFTNFMDWFSLLFWTANMVASCTVGFVENGLIIMEPSRILVQYAKTWFIPDLVVVVPDWIFSIYFANSSGAESVKLLRTLRLLRTVRLLRLLKLWRVLQLIDDVINSEHISILANIIKMIFLLLVVNHFVACMWFEISHLQRDHRPTWIEYHGFDHAKWEYQYMTSIHWSITQFTPASMHVQPQNMGERTFNVFVVVLALVVFSYLVGSITGSLSQLRSMQEDTSKQFWNLRRFLKQNEVPAHLSVRIQKYLEHAWSTRRDRVPREKVALLSHLSDQLQGELLCAMSVPPMLVHPLFERLNSDYKVAMHRLAAAAINRKHCAPGDTLFIGGEKATHMYFPESGAFEYIRTEDDGVRMREQVQTGEEIRAWISEPSLWTSAWVHLGTVLSSTESESLSVDPKSFVEVIKLNPDTYRLVAVYAEGFLEWVNTSDPRELTDIVQGFEMVDTVRAFVGNKWQHWGGATASGRLSGRTARALTEGIARRITGMQHRVSEVARSTDVH